MLRRPNKGSLPTAQDSSAYGVGYGDGTAGYGETTSYGGYPNSASAPSNIYSSSKRRGSKSPLGALLSNALPLACAFCALFLFTTVYYYRMASGLRSILYDDEVGGSLQNAYEDMRRSLDSAHAEISRQRNELRDTHNRLDRADRHARDMREQVKDRNEQKRMLDEWEKREEERKSRDMAVESRVSMLKEKIQRESRRDAEEKFGPGPHRVEITIELPQTDGKVTTKEEVNFTVELASLDLMPHTVHLFLEQVSHKLWDGCTFVINADHIVQAGAHPPETNDEEDPVNKWRPFRDARLDSVSFQEYSPEFPHQKYTVGLAGRPGGPDFYINKMDNSKFHGPYGQAHHELDEEADPCFAKVVDGFDVLDRLWAMPKEEVENDEDDHSYLAEPVHLVRARVVGSKEEDAKEKDSTEGEKEKSETEGKGEAETKAEPKAETEIKTEEKKEEGPQ